MTKGSNNVQQTTHWTLTYWFVNQDEDGDLQRAHEKMELLDKIKNLGIIYAIAGLEVCPLTGRLHLQCAYITTDRYRFEQMRLKFIPHHVESMRKAAWRNRRYCKKDGQFTEIGVLPEGYTDDEPSSNQIATDIIRLSKEGKEDEIIDRFPAQYMRQYSTIQKILSDNEVWNPTGKKVCIWLYSKEYFRTGKSTFLATHFPLERGKTYWHPQFPASDFWERHNRGVKTVVFDDIDRSTPWLGSTLKRVTSDTPCIVNQKFGSALPMLKNILVCSNYLPSMIWPGEVGDAVSARFKFYQAIRHNGRDLMVTPLEKPSILFPLSLINELNKLGFKLIGNDDISINDISILGGSV